MSESLRNAGRTLQRILKAFAARSRVAAAAFVDWLRPRRVELRARASALVAGLEPRMVALRGAALEVLAWLRARGAELGAAVQRGIERLPGRVESARNTSSLLLHRLADVVAPAQAEVEAASEPAAEDGEFAAMLSDLGAEPAPRAQAVDGTLKDAELAALRAEMHNLRDLGDRLAATERERLALVARLAELEGRDDGANDERLTRTREQLARQREKTADWKRKAAERWHEIRAARHRIKELERDLADVRDAAQPGALPRRPEADPQREPGAGRGKARAD